MLNKHLFNFVFVFALCLSNPSHADESDDAVSAANKIMNLMSQGNYSVVWENHMSKFFKSTVTKDSFLANLSIGRQNLGKFISSKFIDQSYAKGDPSTGYQGSVYAFNYLNVYSGIKLYERVVVINQDNTGFKLAGFWANPAQ